MRNVRTWLRRARADQDGSAPAAVLVWCASALTVLAALALLGQGALAQARAATAADLASLAAADALAVGSAAPCARAQEVADVHGTTLEDCMIAGQDVVVRVAAAAGPLPPAHAVARAGPGPPDPAPSVGQRPQEREDL